MFLAYKAYTNTGLLTLFMKIILSEAMCNRNGYDVLTHHKFHTLLS